MLMGDYGWTPRRYEKWLARMILNTVIQQRTDARHQPAQP